MSGFDKRAHLSLFVDFELVVLSGSTVDELFIALCCAFIAAPVSKICSLKVRNTPGAIMRKQPGTLPLLCP